MVVISGYNRVLDGFRLLPECEVIRKNSNDLGACLAPGAYRPRFARVYQVQAV